ncbi:MAG: NAD(+)/NADH kinase [Candidatus Omnitrophica bacterium]|nr:NAD(+)/NADH kinase [Candidatus Omnitrophota bacterium]
MPTQTKNPMNPIKLSNVLIIYNSEKEHALESATQAKDFLTHAGIQAEICPHHKNSDTTHIKKCAIGCDAIVVLGGDGTILGIVRELADSPRPLLGINMGGFGFLTSCASHELNIALRCLIEQRWQIQNRYFLRTSITRTSTSQPVEVFNSLALNEALLTRSQPGRLMELWLGENRESALAYRADGLIMSTATGSTGHSLSAGGPILDPNLAALVITPVSPHSLFNRPLVFGGEKTLHVWFNDSAEELLLILDGQVRTQLHASDWVTIRLSQRTFPTISMPGRTFSEVLRYKFNLRGTP